MTYAMRHSNSKLYLAKVQGDLPRYAGHASRAGLGTRLRFRWTPNIDEALTYETDDDSWFDWFSMGEPPVDFIDIPAAIDRIRAERLAEEARNHG